ncbi:MAG: hypothetical protein ACPGOY_18900 [Rhodospirillaceae bacterium]
MRKIAVAAISFVLLLAVTPGAALADFVGEGLSPSELGPIQIQVLNSALDGCWTNSDDVRNHAKDLLDHKGYDTYIGYKSNSDGYTFLIKVSARKHFGTCVGSIDLSIYRTLTSGNITGSYHVASLGQTFGQPKGVNAIMLEHVQSLLEQMPNE